MRQVGGETSAGEGGDGGGARYSAFISYSHQDERWATWLHRALEHYTVPRRLVGIETRAGPVPRRIYPVFLDREEFATDPSLSARVEEALSRSRNLIVICSPEAAA